MPLSIKPAERPHGEELIKVLEKALKIRELARRGVDGEATAAQGLLDELLKKNGLLPVHLIRYELLKSGRLRPAPIPVMRPFPGSVVIFVNGGWGPGTVTGATNTSTASGAHFGFY